MRARFLARLERQASRETRRTTHRRRRGRRGTRSGQLTGGRPLRDRWRRRDIAARRAHRSRAKRGPSPQGKDSSDRPRAARVVRRVWRTQRARIARPRCEDRCVARRRCRCCGPRQGCHPTMRSTDTTTPLRKRGKRLSRGARVATLHRSRASSSGRPRVGPSGLAHRDHSPARPPRTFTFSCSPPGACSRTCRAASGGSSRPRAGGRRGRRTPVGPCRRS